jgi:hypothetical protein
MIEFQPAYHNDYHAADVLQTVHCLLTQSSLMNLLTHLEIAALVSELIIFEDIKCRYVSMSIDYNLVICCYYS